MSDLGADQCVMAHRLLEWCQDAATYASSAAGYTTERYIEMGAAWYIRGLALDLPGTVGFNDDVVVETWVSSLRRFRSQREYLVFANGQVAGRAHAEWMFLKLDPTTSKVRPFHLDDDMQAAFPLDPEQTIAADRRLAWTGDFQASHSQQRTAQPSEADRYRHVNHVHYAAWITDHDRQTETSPRRLEQLRLHYQADVKPGEVVDLELMTDGSAVQHRLFRDSQPVARAATAYRVAAATRLRSERARMIGDVLADE